MLKLDGRLVVTREFALSWFDNALRGTARGCPDWAETYFNRKFVVLEDLVHEMSIEELPPYLVHKIPAVRKAAQCRLAELEVRSG